MGVPRVSLEKEPKDRPRHTRLKAEEPGCRVVQCPAVPFTVTEALRRMYIYTYSQKRAEVYRGS